MGKLLDKWGSVLVPLGYVASFEYGYTDKAQNEGDARFIRITDIGNNGCLLSENPKFVKMNGEAAKYVLHAGDLVMARTGATYGKTLYVPDDTPAVFASFLIRIQLDSRILNNRFYWYFSKSTYYWEQVNRLVTTGGQPQFNSNALRRIVIAVPTMEKQKEIVSKLDRFDAMVSDLSRGLPAEIAARKAQYEYYRDRLLSFPEKSGAV